MSKDQIVYSVFGCVIAVALVLDLGFLSKKNAVISVGQALKQTFLWVLLALGFFVFVWIEEGQKIGLEFLSGYLMEWRLSIDNIFVFILIFDSFKVKEKNYPRVLLIGILGFFALSAQETVVIYAINDPHGSIDNFPRLKKLIDNDRAQNSKVFFVSAGDLFSGNPIVDYHENKGFPMIDLLNDCGLDISVIGNHEFDYGQEVLNARIEQAQFPFVCDNVSGASGALEAVNGFELITKDGFTIAFVGVVETGSPGLHPLTHPKKVQGLTFTEGLDSFQNYENLKTDNGADLLVALTHFFNC